MRTLILGALIAGAAIGSAAAQGAPARAGLFVSPMGEPFRGGAAHDQWFDGADSNHDGALTLDEMQADAARFFALLDMRGDGEIDPQDIQHYEGVLVPEISSRGPRERSGYRVGDSRVGPGGGEGGPKQVSKRREAAVRQGAGRFGYLD
ncbi:MAG: EF-hand domain-containing protein, partial [Sphingomonadales bacterium]